jgi:hypothetical protein
VSKQRINSAVEPLVAPDTHHLSAAMGWLELGNPVEAAAELKKITPALKAHPDVLEVLWQIQSEQKNWAACLETAKSLIISAPGRASGYINRSYALRRVEGGGLKAARDALSDAEFPSEPIIPYNLACYECQLGHLNQALALLARAWSIGNAKALKLMALNDSDLKPLWTQIMQL